MPNPVKHLMGRFTKIDNGFKSKIEHVEKIVNYFAKHSILGVHDFRKRLYLRSSGVKYFRETFNLRYLTGFSIGF